MYVIDVLPLAPGVPVGTLSYRSKKRLSPGTLVFVPLRARSMPGLVIDVSSVVESKASLKAAGFALRGGTLKTAGKLPEAVLHAAEEIAAYHATTLGSVLGNLLKEVLADELPQTFPAGGGYEELFIEDTCEKRVAAYHKIAEAEHAKKRAMLVVAPTVVEAERLSEAFGSKSALLVTGSIRGKKREEALAAALRSKSIIVTTPSFAWMPIQNLGAVVIERPSANGYVLQKRPYLDIRIALAALAKHRLLTFAYGDLPLPVELRPKPGASLSISFPGPATLIDPKEEQKDAVFAAVPREMLGAIVKAHAANGRSAILAVRKGYGSAVICRDCGNLVRDERGAALSLMTLGTKRTLRSADGVTKADTDVVCATCGSWNLMPLGIGVERVIEELKNALPDADIIRFDTDTVRTSAQAKAATKRMHEKGAVVVGTEIMLPFLDPKHPFDVAAIASADSLLALPFWRARERLVRMGLTLRERSKSFFIATRLPEEVAMDAILHPGNSEFFKEEAEMRKALSYPPFGHLFVFHAEGTKARLDEAATAIGKSVAPLTPVRLAERALGRGRFRLSMVIKLRGDAWPDAELSERVAHIPRSVSVHLDPESLW